MKIIKNDLKFNPMTRRNIKNIALIVLHHQCGKGQTVRQIHDYHKNTLKWAGIGYHYFIDFNGNVFQGRPIEFIGSHCKGNNTNSIGICFEGDFRKDKITPEQIAAGKELIKYIQEVQLKSTVNVLNHNDLYATQCPVLNLKEVLK